jgi:hypothetical protein
MFEKIQNRVKKLVQAGAVVATLATPEAKALDLKNEPISVNVQSAPELSDIELASIKASMYEGEEELSPKGDLGVEFPEVKKTDLPQTTIYKTEGSEYGDVNLS